MTDWREQANCRTIGPELFYEPEHAAAALEVCAGCEVRTDCLNHALSVPEYNGVWGGLRAADRVTITGRRRKWAVS
jgi:WhiB family redox-sensing transcriptional regulator